MSTTRILVILLVLMLYGLAACRSGQEESTDKEAPDGYQLVWADEFDYEGLPDTTKWSYDVGDGCPDICGWGNNELQYYTDSRIKNARVANGLLTIEAHKEDYETRGYTSARLLTRDREAWRYGRFEIRAKLPSGKGTWPAIWMLPENWEYGGWPASGEIDIMEHVGHEPNRVYATVHTEAYNHMEGTQDTDTLRVENAEQAFHDYAIEWTPDSIEWYMDGKAYSSFQNENASYREWPFDQPFHLILNIAVGGNWGGTEGVDDEIWPQQMQIDFVRVYQKTSREP